MDGTVIKIAVALYCYI